MYFIGVDIGSTCAKTVAMDENGRIVYEVVQPTGWSSIEVAENIKNALIDAGIDPEENPLVATGYGRISVPYANKAITEITCHAKGAVWLADNKDVVVIDIGGQDTKIIQIEKGMVKNFVMNDKCSAGTGRFLEIMANSLNLRPNELCELAKEGGGVSISSMCTVFAESEVISLIGKGESKPNIAYGVVESIVNKVVTQCGKMSMEDKVVILTGGLCECDYIPQALSKKLNTEVYTEPRARFAGAIGAALSAKKIAR